MKTLQENRKEAGKSKKKKKNAARSQLATRKQFPCLLQPVLKNVLAARQNSMKKMMVCVWGGGQGKQYSFGWEGLESEMEALVWKTSLPSLGNLQTGQNSVACDQA